MTGGAYQRRMSNGLAWVRQVSDNLCRCSILLACGDFQRRAPELVPVVRPGLGGLFLASRMVWPLRFGSSRVLRLCGRELGLISACRASWSCFWALPRADRRDWWSLGNRIPTQRLCLLPTCARQDYNPRRRIPLRPGLPSPQRRPTRHRRGHLQRLPEPGVEARPPSGRRPQPRPAGPPPLRQVVRRTLRPRRQGPPQGSGDGDVGEVDALFLQGVLPFHSALRAKGSRWNAPPECRP